MNKKNVIIKETYNGKFVENYKYNKKLKIKDYNLYFDKYVSFTYFSIS